MTLFNVTYLSLFLSQMTTTKFELVKAFHSTVSIVKQYAILASLATCLVYYVLDTLATHEVFKLYVSMSHQVVKRMTGSPTFCHMYQFCL